ncbi:hypothetical protein F0L68_29415 [Solihabitans fulvus]|uniref:Septum formation-related domain-containing protein n=1 Tax=Solihabitans fulvus TaxID=1892852 RepID=A0A5B2WT47_9PSEU|nr:DUF4190 domain-containing protein [Solihabitans fulvus]KAA2254901.1 hypothetical protein F0L68_29415 [Solihabitans fulvus]
MSEPVADLPQSTWQPPVPQPTDQPAAWYPQGPAPMPQMAPGEERPTGPTGPTNGLAVTSFVLSLIGGLVISTVLGIVALRQIRLRGERGRGLVTAGFVLSGLWVIGTIVAVVLVSAPTRSQPHAVAAGSSTSARASTSARPTTRAGTATHPTGETGSVQPAQLRAKDCFDGIHGSGQTTILRVTLVPCAQPHDAEMLTELTLTDSQFPGQTAVLEEAKTKCADGAEAEVAGSPILAQLELYVMAPTSLTWAHGDRTVRCVAIDIDGGKLPGPVHPR